MNQVYRQITLKDGIQDFIRSVWRLSGLIDSERYRILKYKDFPKKDDCRVLMFRLDTVTPVSGLPNHRTRNISNLNRITESIGIGYQCILTLVAYGEDSMYALEDLRREMNSTEFYGINLYQPYIGVNNISGVVPRFQLEDDSEYEEQAEMKITFSVQTNVNSIQKLYQIQRVLFETEIVNQTDKQP